MQKTTPLGRWIEVEKTISNFAKVSRTKFLESDGLFFSFSNIYKFSSFKNPFEMITSLPKLYLASEDLFCCYRPVIKENTARVVTSRQSNVASLWRAILNCTS